MFFYDWGSRTCVYAHACVCMSPTRMVIILHQYAQMRLCVCMYNGFVYCMHASRATCVVACVYAFARGDTHMCVLAYVMALFIRDCMRYRVLCVCDIVCLMYAHYCDCVCMHPTLIML